LTLVSRHLSPQEWQRLRLAAACLFGRQQAGRREFWQQLTPEAVKKAFREQARRTHPDLHPQADAEILRLKRERFLRIRESYEVLKEYVIHPAQDLRPSPFPRPRLIAVGGAKGGIGKSMLATNLGVYLSSQGYQTVMVDLDLGGANLHLYLGATALPASINDYLSGAAASLSDLAWPSRYGPLLIGGDSSKLGSANITFAAKMRLVKALRDLPADFVVMDLGSDTSFNILDFFLAADVRLILTTCEPASYLEAYNFIKVALYRRLNRLAADKNFLPQDKSALKELIYKATCGDNGHQVKHLQELLSQVQRRHPEGLPALKRCLQDYQPHLVVNKVRPEDKVTPVVHRIMEVAAKMLGIRVRFLGALPYSEDIHQSLQTLVPWVAQNPQGPLAHKLADWLQKL